MYPSANIVLVCKDENETIKCMNDFQKLIEVYKILQPEIKELNDNGYISFKNGSYIKTIERKEEDNNQPIRSKRFDKFFDGIQDSFIIDDEEFKNIVKPYLRDQRG